MDCSLVNGTVSLSALIFRSHGPKRRLCFHGLGERRLDVTGREPWFGSALSHTDKCPVFHNSGAAVFLSLFLPGWRNACLMHLESRSNICANGSRFTVACHMTSAPSLDYLCKCIVLFVLTNLGLNSTHDWLLNLIKHLKIRWKKLKIIFCIKKKKVLGGKLI